MLSKNKKKRVLSMRTVGIPNTGSMSEVADWVEFFIVTEKKHSSKEQIRSFLESATGEDCESTHLDSIWAELKRREMLYGDFTPYIIKKNIITAEIRWSKRPEYLFWLMLSIAGNTESVQNTGKLFERTSNIAVDQYLNGRSILRGFPTQKKIKMHDLAKDIDERFRSEPSSPHEKDSKADVIAWKPFKDGRSGQVILLVQCATGKNWRSKTTELNLRRWASYIDWASSPLRCFTLPRVITTDTYHETSLDGGIIFDRARLYRLLGEAQLKDRFLRKDLREWCKSNVDRFSAAL